MLSYTGRRNLFGDLCNKSDSTTLTLGDVLMNSADKRILGAKDWPFMHRIRTLVTKAASSTFTAATSDVCTTTGDDILTDTGTQVTVSSTTTLPAGLSASTTYYVIYQSATTFKLATTLANALAGTAVDITDTGTGTHTVSVSTASIFQPLPYDVDQVESVYVTVSGTRHNPIPAPSRKFWDELHYTTSDSDTPEYWFVHEGMLGLWPRPSNDDNIISINARIRIPDLNIADFTTGNIDIVTNGSVSVTGAGTPSWTTPMAGRWLRVTHSSTAASSGDHVWYEINSVPSSTTLTLFRPYGGRSLTTGASAAYIIGQMAPYPDGYHELPVYDALSKYYNSVNPDPKKSTMYFGMFKELMAQLEKNWSAPVGSMVLDEDNGGSSLINPNLVIKL